MKLLIVCSKKSKPNAKRIACTFPVKSFQCETVHRPMLEKDFSNLYDLTEKYKNHHIVAVGGGAVIDFAKMIGGEEKRIVAFPQTASGAEQTSHAVIWGKRKITIKTAKPIYPGIIPAVSLPNKLKELTRYDALAHACDSYWSKKATKDTREDAKEAIKWLHHNDEASLINAGAYAGRAIETTGTNYIHAISYAITTLYHINHAAACGMAFWPVICIMKQRSSNREYIPKNLPYWKPIYIPNHFDIDMILKEAKTYDQMEYTEWISPIDYVVKNALRKYQL